MHKCRRTTNSKQRIERPEVYPQEQVFYRQASDSHGMLLLLRLRELISAVQLLHFSVIEGLMLRGINRVRFGRWLLHQWLRLLSRRYLAFSAKAFRTY